MLASTCGWRRRRQFGANTTSGTPKPMFIDVPQPEQPIATTSGDNLDAAKVAEYQKRLRRLHLEEQGKLVEARAILRRHSGRGTARQAFASGGGRNQFQAQRTDQGESTWKTSHRWSPISRAIELLDSDQPDAQAPMWKVRTAPRDFSRFTRQRQVSEFIAVTLLRAPSASSRPAGNRRQPVF